jgi:hypothetical protein
MNMASTGIMRERRRGDRRLDTEPPEWPVFAPNDPTKFIYRERRADDRRQRTINPPIR